VLPEWPGTQITPARGLSAVADHVKLFSVADVKLDSPSSPFPEFPPGIFYTVNIL